MEDCEFKENIQFPPELDLKSMDYIMCLLPNWKTRIISYEESTGSLTFLLSTKTEEEIKLWIKEFEDKNMSAYSVRSTENSCGRYVLFKQRLKCQHNTSCEQTYDPSNKNRTRNTNCSSCMTITLYPVRKHYRGKDKSKAPDQELPCKICLKAIHNHTLGTADSLRFRPVGEEVKNKLLDLYSRGHTPATALETIKIDIHLNFKDDYHKMLADRRLCPDYMFCYHLYRKEFQKKYGPMDFDLKGKSFLQEVIEKYNVEVADNCARMSFDENNYIICLCPPLFKRTHKLIKAASEMVFIDSSGTLDHDGSRLFILLTHSKCGGLPLGIIITSSESTNVITRGLQLLKEMVGDEIFGGHPDGPLVFLSDDSTAERTAIQTVFPRSKCLLCVFHVLQAVWRWLVKSKNGIPEEKQHEFYQQFKEVINAKTISDCFEKYNNAMLHANNFQNYIKYLEHYWDRKEVWAICYRNGLLINGHYTNNFSEAAIRVIKDKIFDRVKAFNVTQMVDFMLSKFVLYFERRLLDAAHNRLRNSVLGRVARSPPEGLLEQITNIGPGISLVPSETKENFFYIVHTDILLCSCVLGNTGRYCKHIDWVCCIVNSEQYAKNISSTETRKVFFAIATGKEPSNDWLESLYDKNDTIIEATTSTRKENQPQIMTNENIFEVQDNPDISSIILQGMDNIKAISEMLTKALKSSPHEMGVSLEVMKNKMDKLQTVSAIASATATFGSGFQRTNRGNKIPVQPTATSRRKTNICGRNSHVGGRPRKTGGIQKNKNQQRSLAQRVKFNLKCTLNE